MCYVCGKGIDGYEHFNSSKCSLWSNQISDVRNRVPERELHPVRLSPYFTFIRLWKIMMICSTFC